MSKKRFVRILTVFALTAAASLPFPQLRAKAETAAVSGVSAAADAVSQSAESNKDRIYSYLTGTMEMSTAGACGVLGNIQMETGGKKGGNEIHLSGNERIFPEGIGYVVCLPVGIFQREKHPVDGHGLQRDPGDRVKALCIMPQSKA